VTEANGETSPGNDFDPGPHPAREMSLHLLRMLETRMDAAGIALQGEIQLIMARLQLKLLAAAAGFIAIWGGIVLLAIALPPDLRVPVLAAVVVGFIAIAIACYVIASRKASTREIGSLAWFLDSLRLDLEVLSRTLSRSPPQAKPQPQDPQPEPQPDRNPPSDIAA
jgi:uncharacterized membrane protein YqjE